MNEDDIKKLIAWFDDEYRREVEGERGIMYYEVSSRTPSLEDYIEEKLRKYFGVSGEN